MVVRDRLVVKGWRGDGYGNSWVVEVRVAEVEYVCGVGVEIVFGGVVLGVLFCDGYAGGVAVVVEALSCAMVVESGRQL